MNSFVQTTMFNAVMTQDDNSNNKTPQVNSNNVVIHSLDGVDDDELAEIKKWAMRIRVMMITISTLMIITSWYKIIFNNSTILINILIIIKV